MRQAKQVREAIHSHNRAVSLERDPYYRQYLRHWLEDVAKGM